MSLQKHIYSILVVSASENFNSTLLSLLPEARYSPVRTVTSINAAKRTALDREFDFILINSPLPDDQGIRFAIDTCAVKSTAVLLFARSDIHADIYAKVFEYGVFTLPRPTSRSSRLQALDWMASTRERLRRFEKKTISIEEKMAEIRVVNRAKWILVSELKMSEPGAHRYIEKQAMDRCVTKIQVAEEIIKTYT